MVTPPSAIPETAAINLQLLQINRWIYHKSFDYIIIFFICSGDIFNLDSEGGSVLDLDTGSYNKVFGNLFDYGEKKQDEIIYIVLDANKQTR